MEMRRGAAKKFINMGQRVEDVIPVTAFVDSVGILALGLTRNPPS